MSIPCVNEAHVGSLALRDLVMQGSLAKQTAQLSSVPQPTIAVLDSSALLAVLNSLTATDNNARNVAEQAFNRLKDSQPESLVYRLLEVSRMKSCGHLLAPSSNLRHSWIRCHPGAKHSAAPQTSCYRWVRSRKLWCETHLPLRLSSLLPFFVIVGIVRLCTNGDITSIDTNVNLVEVFFSK